MPGGRCRTGADVSPLAHAPLPPKQLLRRPPRVRAGAPVTRCGGRGNVTPGTTVTRTGSARVAAAYRQGAVEADEVQCDSACYGEPACLGTVWQPQFPGPGLCTVVSEASGGMVPSQEGFNTYYVQRCDDTAGEQRAAPSASRRNMPLSSPSVIAIEVASRRRQWFLMLTFACCARAPASSHLPQCR